MLGEGPETPVDEGTIRIKRDDAEQVLTSSFSSERITFQVEEYVARRRFWQAAQSSSVFERPQLKKGREFAPRFELESRLLADPDIRLSPSAAPTRRGFEEIIRGRRCWRPKCGRLPAGARGARVEVVQPAGPLVAMVLELGMVSTGPRSRSLRRIQVASDWQLPADPQRTAVSSQIACDHVAYLLLCSPPWHRLCLPHRHY